MRKSSERHFRTICFQRIVCMMLAGTFVYGSTSAQDMVYAVNKRMATDGYSQSNKKTLRQVLTELEKRYKIKFAYSDRLVSNQYLNGNIAHFHSLDETLKAILPPLGLQYKVVKEFYVIQPRKKESNKDDQEVEFPSGRGADTAAGQTGFTQPTSFEVTTYELNAPPVVITGKVISKNENLPLSGVVVTIKGSKMAVTTDINGNYKITIPDNDAVLIYSHVGFVSQEVLPAGRKTIDVQLEVVVQSLTDVVITVPYGKQTKASYTGAAVTVGEEQIAARPRASVQESLQGNVAGLQTMSGSGQPGSSPNVRIRGIGSYSSANSPLYVVDGIPIIDGVVTTLAFSSNTLAGLNPNDIESVTVLKDASATSVYGSRAANGVILITTKSGAAGKTKINALAQFGVTNITSTKRNKPLSTAEMTELLTEGVLNNTALGITTREDALQYLQTQGLKQDINTDWNDVILQPGKYSQYNVSASGGNDKTTFYTSLGYYKQDAVTKGQGFERMNGRIRVNNKVSNRLSFNGGIGINHQKLNTIGAAGLGQNPVRSLYRLVPWTRPYNEDGSYNRLITYNPELLRNENVYETKIYHLLGNIGAEFKIIDPLSFESKANIDLNYSDDFRFWSPLWQDGAGVNGRGANYTSTFVNWNVVNLLKFRKEVAGIGIDLTLGQEAQKSTIKRVSTQADNYITGASTPMANASTPFIAWSTFVESALISYFLNTSFNYDEKYYLNITGRRDGSSRFGDAYKFGNFGSIGIAWNIHREKFMEGLHFINELKLRSSYGINGNQGSDWYGADGYYSAGANYGGDPGYILGQIQNDKLGWERNKPFDVGIDFEVLNHRLSGTVDYFTRTTTDLLMNMPISPTNGPSSINSNVGSFRNYGVEVTLNSRNIVPNSKNGLEWSTSFNISTVKNRILKLSDDRIITSYYYREPGGDMYTFYLRGYAGVDPQTGEALWYRNDAKEETVTNYNSASPYKHGSALAKFFGGITNTFKYHNISLSFLVYCNWGGQIYDGWGSFTQSDASAGVSDYGAISRMVYQNRWQQPGDNAIYPKMVYRGTQSGLSNQQSTRFLYDGSYIRLRDVTLSYNIPVKKVLTRAQVYVRGNNLVTWVKDDLLPYDPEVYVDGLLDQNLPTAKQILFGVNLSF